MNKQRKEPENDIEEALHLFLEKRRPPEKIREQVDVGFRKEGQSIEIVEIRPNPKDPKVKQEMPIAKATYVKSRDVWKIYWMRADLKWHLYEPISEVNTLGEFLEVVDQDAHACFWG